ncbi:MAG: hypothetical protein ACRENI_05425 [Gemmatimonadaceae bacterium]
MPGRGNAAAGRPQVEVEHPHRRPDLIVPFPARVVGTMRFRSVTAGRGPHSCGITIDDRVHCWGYNSAGQPGYGRKDFLPGTRQQMRAIPVELVFLQ